MFIANIESLSYALGQPRIPWISDASLHGNSSTRQPFKSILCELVGTFASSPVRIQTHELADTTSRQGVATRTPKLVCPRTPLRVGNATSQCVYSQTRKPFSRPTSAPAHLVNKATPQEVNMPPTFRCKHANTLTTSMVNT